MHGVADTVSHFTFVLCDSLVVGGHEIVSCLLSHIFKSFEVHNSALTGPTDLIFKRETYLLS